MLVEVVGRQVHEDRHPRVEPLLDRELERRHLDDERLVRRRATAVVNGKPMLPQVTASMPAARRHAPSIPVVVVFPFVPVTAR